MLHIANITSIFFDAIIILHGPKPIVDNVLQILHQKMDTKYEQFIKAISVLFEYFLL